MMTTLTGLPLELYTNKIIPGLWLDARALCAFSCISNLALEIIYAVANHPINIAGRAWHILASKKETPLKACIFHILKMRILERYYPYHSGTLIHFVLPFDFQKQILKPTTNLAYPLSNALSLHKDPSLAELILMQRGSENIPGASEKGTNLGHALIAAIRINNPKLVRLIMLLPNAKSIVAYNPMNNDCLGVALVEAVKRNSLELTKLVLSHPNAAEIPGPITNNTKRTIGHALLEALDKKNPMLIVAILYHPKAIDLPLVDLIDAGRVILSDEDKATLLQLRQMLENKEQLKEFGKIFVTLTVGIQHLVYVLLCKTHGSLNATIDRDGMVHLIKKPLSLLPIVEQLIK